MNNKYEVKGDITEISIVFGNGEVKTIIDTHMLPKVKNAVSKWCAVRRKGSEYIVVSGYSQAYKGYRRNYLLHRLVAGAEKGIEVDHKNHNTLDNRLENLRKVNRAGNMQNQKGPHKNSKSGVRGVYLNKKSNRWIAQVRANKIRHYLGSFESVEDAEAACIEARQHHHGYSYDIHG